MYINTQRYIYVFIMLRKRNSSLNTGQCYRFRGCSIVTLWCCSQYRKEVQWHSNIYLFKWHFHLPTYFNLKIIIFITFFSLCEWTFVLFCFVFLQHFHYCDTWFLAFWYFQIVVVCPVNFCLGALHITSPNIAKSQTTTSFPVAVHFIVMVAVDSSWIISVGFRGWTSLMEVWFPLRMQAQWRWTIWMGRRQDMATWGLYAAMLLCCGLHLHFTLTESVTW